MLKAYIVFGVILLAVFGSMFAATIHYKGALEQCKAQRDSLKIFVENQNNAIEKLKLDTQSYTATIKAQEQKLKARYQNLKSDKDLETCEAKLDEITKALAIFEDGLVL